MNRPRAVCGTADTYHNITTVPPWEKEDIAQVPYMDSSSPSLSDAEREALPALWAARTNTAAPARPRADTESKSATSTNYGSLPFSEERRNPWGLTTPLTAPPPPRPYETPVYIPPGTKSAPNPPSFAKPPPTPPDSESWSYTTGSTSGSPQSKQGTTALPGTMSSRNTQAKAHQPRPSVTRSETRKRQTRLQRWKSAFKEIFTHHSVDESQFERIQERHWTDDY